MFLELLQRGLYGWVLSVTTKSAFFPSFEKLDGGMVIATQLLVYLAIIKVQIANKKEDFFLN